MRIDRLLTSDLSKIKLIVYRLKTSKVQKYNIKCNIRARSIAETVKINIRIHLFFDQIGVIDAAMKME